MNLVIASDYSGVALKDVVKNHLISAGHKLTDVGHQNRPGEKMAYYDTAINLVKEFRKGGYDRGLLFCGTGAGVSIVANMHKGIHCIPCESVYTARQSSIVNNTNVIAMGYNVVGPDNACKIADAWLEQSFAKGMDAERKEWLTTLYNRVLELEKDIS